MKTPSVFRLPSSVVLSVVLLAFCCAIPAAQDRPVDLVQRVEAYRFGGDASALDAAAKWVAEARLDPTKRPEVARALAEVLKSDAPFDAKQFVCRELVYIASDEQIPVLAGLLGEAQLSHCALMVLARIPGNTVNEALLAALPHATGLSRVEIADTLADRGDARVIPSLTAALNSSDTNEAQDAAAGLARLAAPATVTPLKQAYTAASGERRLMLGHALAAWAARRQAAGDSARAVAIYTLLSADSAPPVLRAAALRGLVLAQGDQGMGPLFAALGEDGTPRQKAAAALLYELPIQQIMAGAAYVLPKLSERGTALLLTALADRGDPRAEPAALAAAGSKLSAVRLAAYRALGSVGGAEDVPALLNAAAAGSLEEKAAARASLAELRGRGVDAKLLAALESQQPPAQVAAIQALGDRGAPGAVPTLLKEAGSTQPEVSAAALQVLRDTASPGDLPAILDLLLSRPAGERDEAIETAAEVARRGADESQRTGALLQKESAAKDPADRVDLLAVLAQVGGPNALEALRQGLADLHPEVKAASLRLLAEWQSDAPMDDLLRIVRSSQDAKERTIALRGYIRMIGLNEQRPADQALALYQSAGSLAKLPEERRLILSGLEKVHSLGALQAASGFLADNEVRPEAEAAVVEIAQSTLGAWPEKSRAALEPIAANGTTDDARKKAGALLAVLPKFGDYVMAWEYSPAYQQQGADYRKLFDISFPPEQPEHEKEVPWKLLPVGGSPDQPWLLDLLAALGGEQRVAYLRTNVWSETARDLTLELGSDDGVKAWWNGEVVAADNTARAVAPGQEKVKVHANAGWNRLLLKVTQNNQGWGAVARFANPDGTPATGLKFSVAP